MLHAAAVALLAVLLSLGTVWLGYVVHVWRVAARSPVVPPRRMTVLVFGRRLVAGAPGPDYRLRLARAQALMQARLADQVLLLGGRSGGSLSEAAAGERWLRQHGLPAGVRVALEEHSADSLENLRQARQLLRPANGAAAALPPVALLTSRYHLARCLLLARRLGFAGQPVAAEAMFALDRRQFALLLMEATYLMWIDLGVRWAQLVGHRRMAQRIS